MVARLNKCLWTICTGRVAASSLAESAGRIVALIAPLRCNCSADRNSHFLLGDAGLATHASYRELPCALKRMHGLQECTTIVENAQWHIGHLSSKIGARAGTVAVAGLVDACRRADRNRVRADALDQGILWRCY